MSSYSSVFRFLFVHFYSSLSHARALSLRKFFISTSCKSVNLPSKPVTTLLAAILDHLSPSYCNKSSLVGSTILVSFINSILFYKLIYVCIELRSFFSLSISEVLAAVTLLVLVNY
nr:MAG TPA: hypothetical protein [Caudoviricetes sp.]DAK71353.1 MAG TPA: hypothetical protein [Caudoviricetes sp.]